MERCSNCGFERVAYNSCRNRHCPKCQARASAEWLSERARDLLPVEYFHVVFTVPEEVAAIALQNKKEVYSILFRASAETLRQIAADPKHLGAEIGFVAVLHTWGQNLHHHPHVHCVVPGGGLSPNGENWVSCPRGFLLPVKVLGAVYRSKFLDELSQAFAAGRLTFQGSLAPLSAGRDFRRLMCKLRTKPWVVYAKRPFAGPQVVLKYLARYTHRVAISNRRLLSLAAGQVRFRWRDYRTGRRWRVLTLPAVEFIRRFLLHTLPRGFVRIRHFGILANRCREARLLLCRHLLGVAAGPAPCFQPTSDPDAARCPSCGRPALVRAETVKARTPAWDAPVPIDSS